MKFIHYSIDDVISVFEILTRVHPKSIFDISLFAYLQQLHYRYGFVVSCYCFYRKGRFTLSDVSRSYIGEFERNSSWLKFGFHGYDGNEDYDNQNIKESIRQYRNVVFNLREIVGSKSLDLFPRIHSFKGSEEFQIYLAHNDDFSLKGLLAADDDRISYSLSSEENGRLKDRQLLGKNNLLFIRTTQRFDCLRPYMIKKMFCHSGGVIELFTHEWLFLNTSSCKTRIKAIIIKYLMKLTCEFYIKKGYRFAFFENVYNQLSIDNG